MPNSSDWQKSSFSGGEDGDNCVELAHGQRVIALREGDAPDTALDTEPALVAGLIRHLKGGR